MIMDKNMLAADALAYDGTPTVLDLGTVGPGPGKPVRCFAQGSATLNASTGLTITDGITDTAATAYETIVGTLDAGGYLEFTLRSDVARYLKISLAGSPDAGAWTAGILMESGQTNR